MKKITIILFILMSACAIYIGPSEEAPQLVGTASINGPPSEWDPNYPILKDSSVDCNIGVDFNDIITDATIDNHIDESEDAGMDVASDVEVLDSSVSDVYTNDVVMLDANMNVILK